MGFMHGFFVGMAATAFLVVLGRIYAPRWLTLLSLGQDGREGDREL